MVVVLLYVVVILEDGEFARPRVRLGPHPGRRVGSGHVRAEDVANAADRSVLVWRSQRMIDKHSARRIPGAVESRLSQQEQVVHRPLRSLAGSAAVRGEDGLVNHFVLAAPLRRPLPCDGSQLRDLARPGHAARRQRPPSPPRAGAGVAQSLAVVVKHGLFQKGIVVSGQRPQEARARLGRYGPARHSRRLPPQAVRRRHDVRREQAALKVLAHVPFHFIEKCPQLLLLPRLRLALQRLQQLHGLVPLRLAGDHIVVVRSPGLRVSRLLPAQGTRGLGLRRLWLRASGVLLLLVVRRVEPLFHRLGISDDVGNAVHHRPEARTLHPRAKPAAALRRPKTGRQ
mmetsp:Transcript_21073/g.72708  ORF Transcript_21073/g.72708 Transcript_21073/m.72708 type:complete len:342 (-) Transcript_21073:24-1049(-)